MAPPLHPTFGFTLGRTMTQSDKPTNRKTIYLFYTMYMWQEKWEDSLTTYGLMRVVTMFFGYKSM